MSIRDFFQKHKKILLTPDFLMVVYNKTNLFTIIDFSI